MNISQKYQKHPTFKKMARSFPDMIDAFDEDFEQLQQRIEELEKEADLCPQCGTGNPKISQLEEALSTILTWVYNLGDQPIKDIIIEEIKKAKAQSALEEK